MLSISSPTLGDAGLDDPIAVASATDWTQGAAEPRAESLTNPVTFTIRSGDWHSPSTWYGGVVPSKTTNVVILHDIVMWNAETAQVEVYDSHVTLAGDVHAYGSIILHHGSALEGTQGSIYFHVPDDRLFKGNTTPGPMPGMPDFHPDDIGLWVMMGASLDLRGDEVTSFVEVSTFGSFTPVAEGVWQSNGVFGSNITRLEQVPVGWMPGDTLVFTNELGEWQLARLRGVSTDNQIVYDLIKDSPTDPDFMARVLRIGEGAEATFVRPKVANLTRRMKIVGADVVEGDTHHRAHVTIMGGASSNLEYIEFLNLGPRGKLGRYPIHWHLGDQISASLIGSSIWQNVDEGGNRFMSIHNVQGVHVENNVGFRAVGHGYFMEQGREFGNQIIGNLSIDVNGPEEIAGASSPVGSTSHHFWLRGGNTIANNVAVGGGAIGMIVLPSTSTDPSAVVNGFEAIGVRKTGVWPGRDGVEFNDVTVVGADESGLSTGFQFFTSAKNITLRNPAFALNGPGNAYPGQIWLSLSQNLRVFGGVIAGETGVHLHYQSTAAFYNTVFYTKRLAFPSYWETSALFDHVRVTSEALFGFNAPVHQAAPGLMSFVDAQVKLNGAASFSTLNADFIRPEYVNFPTAHAGQGASEAAWRLVERMPQTGFIQVYANENQKTAADPFYWTVSPLGQTPSTSPKQIFELESRWQQAQFVRGYSHGFPPGIYLVRLYNQSLGFIREGYAVVVGGQVTRTLLTAPPVTGDANGDQRVDIFDVAQISNDWNNYRVSSDMNRDGAIDIFDIAVVSNNWSPPQSAPTAAGDVTGDGIVDIFDVAAVSNAWGDDSPSADANFDGVVDIFDIAIISAHWTPALALVSGGDAYDEGDGPTQTPPSAPGGASAPAIDVLTLARLSSQSATVAGLRDLNSDGVADIFDVATLSSWLLQPNRAAAATQSSVDAPVTNRRQEAETAPLTQDADDAREAASDWALLGDWALLSTVQHLPVAAAPRAAKSREAD